MRCAGKDKGKDRFAVLGFRCAEKIKAKTGAEIIWGGWGLGNFRGLKVWQRSKDLAVYVYSITGNGDFSRDFGLKDQIRRAAVSIASNIAEGDELNTNKQAIHFFFVAKGSTAEVLTQAIISHEIGYIDTQSSSHIQEECDAISRMLTKLIQARKKQIP